MINAFHFRHAPFQALTTAVILVLVFPAFFQHGMFMDGTQYAVVARNMAEGKGTFWFPFLSASWEKHGQNCFLEHPPLAYWLQSWFFRIFNSSIYSERLYALVTFLLSAQFIRMIWRLMFKGNELRYFSWLPVLLWAVIPTVYWSYNNNMLENTVSVFVLAAVFFAILSFQNKKNALLYLWLSGSCVFLAILTKGITGLFPLVVVFIYSWKFRSFSFFETVKKTLAITLVPTLLFTALLYFSDEAYKSLMFYFKERLVFRVNHTAQVESRWLVLWWLISDLIVPAGLILLFYLFGKWRQLVKSANLFSKHVLFFAFVGLAGTLPLLLTFVQRAVYYAPALPYFALSLSFLILPVIQKWNEKPDIATIRYGLMFSWLLVAGAAIYPAMQFGKTSRDEEVLKEVHVLGKELKKDAVVGVPYSIYDNWDFQFYLLRYYSITLNPYPGMYQYKMLESSRNIDDAAYSEMKEIALSNYKIYKLRN